MSLSRILGFLLVASSIAATAFAQGPSPSIRLLDYYSGQPVTRVQEMSRLTVEITDSASAGLGILPLQFSSDLRGDQEPSYADELPPGSGVFLASFFVEARFPAEPDALEALTVTEDAGPPQRYDTVRVTLSCPTAPCPEATFPVYASELHFLDTAGQPLPLIPVGSSFVIDVADNAYYYSALIVTSQPGGDTEVIYPFYVGGFPNAFHSRATVATAAGPAVPNDFVLQIEDGGTVTVSHENYLRLTTTTLTAPTGSLLELLGRDGNPVQHVFANGPVRVRYTSAEANLDPGTPDSVTVHLRTIDLNDATRDTEDLQIQETGPSTGVFTGQIPSRMNYFPVPHDGTLDSWRVSGQSDRVEVTAGAQTAIVPILASVVRVVDATGADLEEVGQGDLVRLQGESDEYNMSPTLWEMMWIWVRSNTTGDQEYPVILSETGPNTSRFEGSFQTVAGTSPVPSNGSLEVQVGETLVAEHQSLFGFSSDTAVVVHGTAPPNLPPVAVDETVDTQPGVPIEIPVLANDSDPDGDPLTIVLVTQPSSGGSVTQSGPSTVLYTPPSTSVVDSFLYRIADSHGAEAVGIVTVRVVRRPVAVDDAYALIEDHSIIVTPMENDENPDAQNLAIASVEPPAHGGTILLDPVAGTVQYSPNFNYYGPDSFTYTLEGGSVGTVTVTVTSENDPPELWADAATTPEDTARSIAVLSNDEDWDGDPMSVTGVTQGAHGTVTFNASGVTYTPALNYYGPDAFTYTVSDGHGGTASASVSVTVTAVNDPPSPGADAATTPEDTAKSIAVLANDSDPEGNPLAVTGVTQGSHGTVTFTASGVTYTPASNYNGSDAFTYTVSDGNGGSATGSVSVTVTPVNDPPSPSPDAATTPEDTAKTIAVLDNDSDVDGDSLSVFNVSYGFHGIVTFTASSVTYTPVSNYHGTDTFTYTVRDGNGGYVNATVTMTVTPANDVPTAGADAATTPEDTAKSIAVLANDSDLDGDSLSVTGVTQGTHGTVTFTSSGVTYTPASNYNGSDTFTYTVSDGNGGSAAGSVSVTVTGVNDLPSANADSATTPEDAAKAIAVLGNDSDLDGDSLSVTGVTQGVHGSVSFTASGVTYTPASNYNGSDAFTYTISDGNGGSASGSVSVTVTAVNDPPSAGADAATTPEDTAKAIAVLGNDSDPDGDSLVVTGVTQGSHGTVSFTSSGVTYTPASNYNGSDAFTYTVSDGNGGSATGSVTVTVTSVNDTPSAGADSATTPEDTPKAIAVLGNDSDPEGDALAVTGATQGAHGAVSFIASEVTYTPASNYNGPDAFTYTISDGNGGSAIGSVSVTVTPVNDAPVAGSDAAATPEDTPKSIAVLSNDSDLDGDSLSVTGVTQGAHGTVTFNASSVTYTPASNYNGPDAFTYTVSDGNGGSATGSVTVTVTPVNDPPVAVADGGATREGVAVTLSVLANDSDIDGGALSVVAVATPAHGTASFTSSTVTYTPAANFNGTETFTYTMSDGAATASATIVVTVANALERVAVLGTHGVWVQTGADVLSGDVVANQAGAAPFLNGGVELFVAGSATTPAGWDVAGNRVTVAAGATVASDVFANTLTNSGTVTGPITSTLALPVFASLPAFLAATPGASDVNVAVNGSLTLAPGSYRDLIVGKKGTVIFTGGTYHFRSISADTQVKLLFSAASTVRVQQKVSVKATGTIGPNSGSSISGSAIVFHVGGVNGTTGGLAATPKALDIGIDGIVTANFYVPNGTLQLSDRTLATGAFLGLDVQVGPNVQVALQSAWTGQ